MDGYFRVTQLDENRYRIYDPLGVHTDLFTGKEKALLFDTGYGFRNLKKEVDKITNLPLYVVNSHGHVDHSLGNADFEGEIYIHPDDMAVCRDHHGEYRKRLAIAYAGGARDFFTGEKVHAIGEDFDEKAYLQRSFGNLIPVREGHIFDLGGLTLEVIHLPGHTPGSIGLLYKEKKILYAGDAANNDLWLFMKEACPLSVYIKTLKKAMALDFETIIISHYPAPLPGKVLEDYLDTALHVSYDRGLPFSAPLAPEAEARTVIREGYTPEDMGKEGYADIVISEDKIDI